VVEASVEKTKLKASKLAMAVYALLRQEAPEVLDPAATADMDRYRHTRPPTAGRQESTPAYLGHRREIRIQRVSDPSR